MMGYGNPVPFFKTLPPFPGLFNGSRYLVSQHKRGLFNPVPLHHIASAYAACLYLYKKFSLFYPRPREILNPYISIVVIYGGSHQLSRQAVFLFPDFSDFSERVLNMSNA